MKKLIAILLTLAAVLSFAAVSASAEDYLVDTAGKTDVLEGLSAIILSNECNYKTNLRITDGIYAKSTGSSNQYINEKVCGKNAQAALEAEPGPWAVPLTTNVDKYYYYTIEFTDVNADIDSFCLWFNNENVYSSGVWSFWQMDSAFDILVSTDGGNTYSVVWESTRLELTEDKTAVVKQSGYTKDEGGDAEQIEVLDNENNIIYQARKIEGSFGQTLKGVTNIVYGCVNLRRAASLEKPTEPAPHYYIARISEFDVYGTKAEVTTAEETTEEGTTAEITTAATSGDTTAEITTAAASGDTTAEVTTAENKNETTTTAPAEKSGCGSSVACGAVIVVSILGAALLKKKEN